MSKIVVKKAAFGAVMLSASNVFKVLLQFALVPVLAHLLAPADFGLVGMAMPVVVGVNLLCDFGLGNVLMRAPEATPRLQSTIFWSTVSIGGCLALIFAGAAPFLASALQHPALTPILVMLAPVLIFGGAVTAPSAQLVRDQRYASFAASDAASAIGGGLVCLAAAYANFGAWALVAQQLTYWCIRFIWIMRVSGVSVMHGMDRALLRNEFSFGANATGSNILDFAAGNLDNVIIGMMLGVPTLGQYVMAYQFIRAPGLALSGPLIFSIYPILTRFVHEPERFRRLVLEGLTTLSIIVAPVFAGLACVAAVLIQMLLPPVWAPVAHILPWLAPVGALFALNEYVSYAFMALGRADLRLRLSIMRTVLVLVGVAMGSLWRGLDGAAMALCAALVIVAPVSMVCLARELKADIASVLLPMRVAVLAVVPMVAAVLAIGGLLREQAPALQLAAEVTTGVIVYAGLIWLQFGAAAMQRVTRLFASPA